jgi:hypothetical protein
MRKTGSCFRRDQDCALIECRSFENESGNVWTEEVVLEPAAEPAVDPADQAATD